MPKFNSEVTFAIPGSDSRACETFRVFASTIASDPSRYNLTPGDAAKLTQTADAFDEALLTASTPSLRSAMTIDAKTAARKAAEAVFRDSIARIKADATIAVADKLALGYKPAKPKRTITEIHTAPLLHISHIDSDGCHILHYADEKTPSKRTKPPGIHHLELQIIIAAQPTPSPSPAAGGPGTAGGPGLPGAGGSGASGGSGGRTERITRSPARIQHDPKNAGQTATYYARWSTAPSKNKNPITGPWSLPVSMTVVKTGSLES